MSSEDGFTGVENIEAEYYVPPEHDDDDLVCCFLCLSLILQKVALCLHVYFLFTLLIEVNSGALHRRPYDYAQTVMLLLLQL